MTTFLLIRHGETDAVGRTMAGRMPGWHLNPQGREQVQKLADKLSTLPLKAVYTSPLERAVETAVPIARRHGLEPQSVTELNEMHVGEWEGLSFEELETREEWKRFNTYRSATRCPGGEMMLDVQTRMMAALKRLRRIHMDEAVAVVSHGDPLRSAVAYYLGIPLDFMLRFEISPASLSVVEASDWGVRVLCLNATVEALP